jgi:uncharacterized protein (DUF1501 family)
MTANRRDFLKLSATGAFAALAAPRLVFSQGAAAADLDTLVVVFLRGGLDGMHAVVPYADAGYATLRPTLKLGRPDAATNAALDLDGFFGLHPKLAPLLPLYKANRLAAVHATGFAQGSRSHFTCQDGMERAADAALGVSSGWLGRYVETLDSDATFKAMGVGRALQPSLRGAQPAIGLVSLDTFALQSESARAGLLPSLFGDIYARTDLVNSAAQLALDAVDEMTAADPAHFAIEGGASYPNTTFGAQMAEVAQLIKAGLGLRVVCCDLGGWDSHAGQSAMLDPMLDDLGGTLAAFDKDLGARMSRVTVVTMTDFGRRAGENGSGGTDHGTAQAMLLMGGGLTSGRVVSQWPGLASGDLADGDLKITLDYRTILSELLDKRMGAADLAHVFPGFTPGPYAGAFV